MPLTARCVVGVSMMTWLPTQLKVASTSRKLKEIVSMPPKPLMVLVPVGATNESLPDVPLNTAIVEHSPNYPRQNRPRRGKKKLKLTERKRTTAKITPGRKKNS